MYNRRFRWIGILTMWLFLVSVLLICGCQKKGEKEEAKVEKSQVIEKAEKPTIQRKEETKKGQEAPKVEWDKTFGGSETDKANFVQQTTDGGYILVGCTESYGAGKEDVWLIKTDTKGNKVWDKIFGGLKYDRFFSVQQTIDNGYILAGWTESYGAGLWDVWLIKTDTQGNKVWEQTFGGPDRDWANSVQQTTDGGYILVGGTESYGARGADAWLVKTDAEGNKEWEQTFGGSHADYAYSVQQTNDNGYILAGWTYSYGAGGDAWLVKTDTEGNKEWEQTFGGSESDYAHSVQQTPDGGYILAGIRDSRGVWSSNAWLIKTDTQGNKVWEQTFGGPDRDRANCVQQTPDGGYILAGSASSYGAGYSDAWLIKTDAEGNKEWDQTFGGSREDWADSVQQTTDGGYILAGETRSYGAGSADAWLIKLSSGN